MDDTAGEITVSTRSSKLSVYHVLCPLLIVLRLSDEGPSRGTQGPGLLNQLRVLLPIPSGYKSSGHNCLRPLWLW